MKEKFSLIGIDGNAWCIMAYVNMAMRKCGIPPRERNEYMHDVMKGDYDTLVAKSAAIIDNLNANYRNN